MEFGLEVLSGLVRDVTLHLVILVLRCSLGSDQAEAGLLLTGQLPFSPDINFYTHGIRCYTILSMPASIKTRLCPQALYGSGLQNPTLPRRS